MHCHCNASSAPGEQASQVGFEIGSVDHARVEGGEKDGAVDEEASERCFVVARDHTVTRFLKSGVASQ